jgi:hypothetical protein
MTIALPLYGQEKDNTCALACLRMVLAACAMSVSESELESRARMDPRGTPIDELQRLARMYRLLAEIEETTVEDLGRILSEGKWPIAYIDRPCSTCDRASEPGIPSGMPSSTRSFPSAFRPGLSRSTIRARRESRARRSLCSGKHT